MYGRGEFFSYGQRALEFTGLLLVAPFIVGFCGKIRSTLWVPVTTAFLLLFLLHTLFRTYGLFGEAGYPRYMVTVAPAIAVLTLAGWNRIVWWLRGSPPWASAVLGWSVLAVSLAANFQYLDSFASARDPIAIREMDDWLRTHPQPYKRLIWSNARMCIVAGLTLMESPSLGSSNRETNLALLRQAPPGTLVFWDNHFGPDWFGLSAAEIQKEGYQLLRTRRYWLPGYLIRDEKFNRQVELSLLLRP